MPNNKMVCIKKGAWTKAGKLVREVTPNYGEIVEVIGTGRSAERPDALILKGYEHPLEHGRPRLFNPDRFRKIVDDEPKAADQTFINLLKTKETTDA